MKVSQSESVQQEREKEAQTQTQTQKEKDMDSEMVSAYNLALRSSSSRRAGITANGTLPSKKKNK
jgi:hypothetical protein